MHERTGTIPPARLAELQQYAIIGVGEELRARRRIQTTAEKIDFIQNGLEITYDELAEVLPSDEQGDINPQLLDQVFAFTSLLKRKWKPRVLQSMVRSFGLELLQQGEAKILLGTYHEAFRWSYKG